MIFKSITVNFEFLSKSLISEDTTNYSAWLLTIN